MFSRTLGLVLVLLLSVGLFLPATAMAQESSDVEVKDSSEIFEVEESESETLQQQDAYYQGGAAPAGTIVGYTLAGGVVGALVGTGLWLLDGLDWNPLATIGTFTGGGLLVGAGVGTIIALSTVVDQPVTASMEDKSSSVKWMERDMPKTYDIPVLQLDF